MASLALANRPKDNFLPPTQIYASHAFLCLLKETPVRPEELLRDIFAFRQFSDCVTDRKFFIRLSVLTPLMYQPFPASS